MCSRARIFTKFHLWKAHDSTFHVIKQYRVRRVVSVVYNFLSDDDFCHRIIAARRSFYKMTVLWAPEPGRSRNCTSGKRTMRRFTWYTNIGCDVSCRFLEFFTWRWLLPSYRANEENSCDFTMMTKVIESSKAGNQDQFWASPGAQTILFFQWWQKSSNRANQKTKKHR